MSPPSSLTKIARCPPRRVVGEVVRPVTSRCTGPRPACRQTARGRSAAADPSYSTGTRTAGRRDGRARGGVPGRGRRNVLTGCSSRRRRARAGSAPGRRPRRSGLGVDGDALGLAEPPEARPRRASRSAAASRPARRAEGSPSRPSRGGGEAAKPASTERQPARLGGTRDARVRRGFTSSARLVSSRASAAAHRVPGVDRGDGARRRRSCRRRGAAELDEVEAELARGARAAGRRCRRRSSARRRRRSGSDAAQADRPVAAVGGAGRSRRRRRRRASASIEAVEQLRRDLRRVHARRAAAGAAPESSNAPASRASSPPSRWGRTSKPAPGSQSPGSPSSTRTRRAAGRLGDGRERVGEAGLGDRGRAGLAEVGDQPGLRPPGNGRFGDHDQGYVTWRRFGSSHRPGHVADRAQRAAHGARHLRAARRARGRRPATSSIRQPASAARSTISSGQPKRRSRSPRASSGSRRAARIGPMSVSAPGAAADHQRQRPVGEPRVQRPGAAARRRRAPRTRSARAGADRVGDRGQLGGSSEPSQSMKQTTSAVAAVRPAKQAAPKPAPRLGDDVGAELARRSRPSRRSSRCRRRSAGSPPGTRRARRAAPRPRRAREGRRRSCLVTLPAASDPAQASAVATRPVLCWPRWRRTARPPSSLVARACRHRRRAGAGRGRPLDDRVRADRRRRADGDLGATLRAVLRVPATPRSTPRR